MLADSGFLGLLLRVIVSVLLWLVLFPVVWFASLPLIMIYTSIWRDRRDPYLFTVQQRWNAVHELWCDTIKFFYLS